MSELHPGVQAAVDRLNAERYGPSLWWETPKKTAAEQDAAAGERAVLDLAHDADDQREESA